MLTTQKQRQAMTERRQIALVSDMADDLASEGADGDEAALAKVFCHADKTSA